jgi:hypothetical protein
VMAREIAGPGCVVSHLCDRKKSQRWGTECFSNP